MVVLLAGLRPAFFGLFSGSIALYGIELSSETLMVKQFIIFIFKKCPQRCPKKVFAAP